MNIFTLDENILTDNNFFVDNFTDVHLAQQFETKKLLSENYLNTHKEEIANLERTQGSSPVILLCEHASHKIPARFGQLGLDDGIDKSHIAYDLGAQEVAQEMSRILDAPLILATNSRLVYDLNRSPIEQSAIPAESEIYRIPGNVQLSSTDWHDRANRYYWPFVDAATKIISQRSNLRYLVTIHSFTPRYFGNKRDTEIGFLHDVDKTFTERVCENFKKHNAFRTKLNSPYSAVDGVTHNLRLYGQNLGLKPLMIEVRNDLINTDANRTRLAEALSGSILRTLEAADCTNKKSTMPL